MLLDHIHGFWPILIVLSTLYAVVTSSGIICLHEWLQNKTSFAVIAVSMFALGWAVNPVIYKLNLEMFTQWSVLKIAAFYPLAMLLWAVLTGIILWLYFKTENAWYDFKSWLRARRAI